MKIKFKTNDDLPLSKIISIPGCVIIISNIFKEDNEYHPQVLLHDFMSMKKICKVLIHLFHSLYIFLINILVQ